MPTNPNYNQLRGRQLSITVARAKGKTVIKSESPYPQIQEVVETHNGIHASWTALPRYHADINIALEIMNEYRLDISEGEKNILVRARRKDETIAVITIKTLADREETWATAICLCFLAAKEAEREKTEIQ